MRSTCRLDGCDEFVRVNGLCNRHNLRLRRTGDPRHGASTSPRMISERFWGKVQESGDCWVWTAATTSAGYGAFNIAGRGVVLAHRFAYEDMVARVPDGLVLDHLCRSPLCVNPFHLEPVTDAINSARGANPAWVSHMAGACQKGHPARLVNGHLRCLECRRARNQNKKEQVA